jgi:hypothetical protein
MRAISLKPNSDTAIEGLKSAGACAVSSHVCPKKPNKVVKFEVVVEAI